MKRITRVIAFIMALSMILAGCAGKPKDAVAKVNGDYITKEEFDREYNIFRKMLYGFMTDEQMEEVNETGTSIKSDLENQITEILITDKIVKDELKKKKVEITEEEKNQGKQDMIEKAGGEEQFKAQVEGSGLEEEDIDYVILRGLRQQKLIDNYIKENPVSDEELNKYYEENKDRLVKYDVAHILVDTEEEAKEIKKQLDEGADFAELAKEKSTDDGSKEKGGDLGEVNMQTAFVPEFLEGMKNLKSGEISEPVKSQFGYHIIYVKNIVGDLDDVKLEIQREMVQSDFQAYVNKLYENSNIEIYKSKAVPEQKPEEKKEENQETQNKDTQENKENQTEENNQENNQENNTENKN